MNAAVESDVIEGLKAVAVAVRLVASLLPAESAIATPVESAILALESALEGK
jgi:hypothetical protein